MVYLEMGNKIKTQPTLKNRHHSTSIYAKIMSFIYFFEKKVNPVKIGRCYAADFNLQMLQRLKKS
jgi:hypothetical protein